MNENNASQPELTDEEIKEIESSVGGTFGLGPVPFARAIIAAMLSKQRASDAAQAVAWMHEEDETRVISAQQKAQAERDGGAYASSLRPYTIALGRISLPQASGGAAGGEEVGALKSATLLDRLGVDRTAWEADMVAAGAKHLGDECWEWETEDFEFRLWQQAIIRARSLCA
ncbi:hypothetical protein [Achromobacter aegrifaciens]